LKIEAFFIKIKFLTENQWGRFIQSRSAIVLFEVITRLGGFFPGTSPDREIPPLSRSYVLKSLLLILANQPVGPFRIMVTNNHISKNRRLTHWVV
jgi:hypothetical protein